MEVLKDLAIKEKHAAKSNLSKIKKLLEQAGVAKVITEIEVGDARDEIVKVAKRYACDLIVMSTHGRSGFKRALLGSVADDVVRNSPCPVLLIHPNK
jgi:nucleotide-binding universal stress UspA family protein